MDIEYKGVTIWKDGPIIHFFEIDGETHGLHSEKDGMTRQATANGCPIYESKDTDISIFVSMLEYAENSNLCY